LNLSVVDEFYNDYRQLVALLNGPETASLRVSMNDKLSRALVLVIANFYEGDIKEILLNLFRTKSSSPLIHPFLESSMERRYHEFFDWKAQNANKFFAMFGDAFRRQAMEDVRNTRELEEGVRAFMEIGQMRNVLAHEQLLGVLLPKTADEYYALHQKALVFIQYLRERLV
jgi:RiboL-PSP-HEPN